MQFPTIAALFASAVAAASGAETLTLQCDGSVRLPGMERAVTPRLVVDGVTAIAVGEGTPTAGGGVAFELRATGKGLLATGVATLKAADEGRAAVAEWRFTLAKDAAKAEPLAILQLPRSDFGRGEISVGDGTATVRGIRLAAAARGRPASAPGDPELSDDSDRWPYHPLWRLTFGGGAVSDARAGDALGFAMEFAPAANAAGGAPRALRFACAGPTVVPGCGGWVPMEHRKDVLPGSALDFSRVIPRDAPAGKHGWLRGVGDHAEFEGLPGVAQRFCGVNLCQTANFPETPEEAATLAERIFRLGYNAVRIHHHDGSLARYENGVLVPDEAAFDKLDRLVAECVSRGIYLTTDLYVSRRATWRDLGIDRDGDAPMKAVQFATERGFRDWCDFARLFLTHVNPYTGRALADEPALISLCTQNECFWNKDFKATCAVPELGLARLWARFLDEERKKSPGAWAGLSPERPPARTLPWTPETEEDSALYAFWNWLHGRFYRRAERFLRRELGVRTLLTGDNFALLSGSVLEMQDAAYGYCDVHSYQNVFVDWVDRRWEQPLRAGSCNPVFRTRGMPEDTLGYGRLWGKPFFVTEWDYDGINAYRSMAGLSFGSMGALQAWTGMWRFAFDHSRRNLPDDTGVPGLFNLARDPLALAGDRATLSLYLRRDMAEATDTLAVDFTDALLAAAKGRDWRPAPGWRGGDVAWTHRVGAIVRGKDAPPKARVVARDEFERLGASAFTKPDSGVRGQRVSIDRARGTFAVSTPRTCGVFARGGRFEAGALSVMIGDETHAENAEFAEFDSHAENAESAESAAGHSSPVTRHSSLRGGASAATVFATSLDGAPLAESRRILVTHLTDCRARGFATTDALGTLILRWSGDANPDGTMPLFLKEGTAEVSLALNPAEWRVWALGTDGRRECKVPCAFDPATSRLRFTASVRQPFGGCMNYEIVREGRP